MFDVPDSAENAPSTAWTPHQSTDSPQQSVARPAVARSAAEHSAARFVAPNSSAAEPLAPKPSASGKKCPEALADEITTLAGHLNAAQHRFLKLLDEFDRHQGWAGPGVRSLAHWLNWKCGIGDLAAREKVRVARALRDLPKIDAAFERGEVSYSKVRAMTRAATPKNEAQLLNIARHGTAEHMERLVRVYRRARQRAEASPGEKERRREERFHCIDEDDETMVFGGRVSIEQGRLLVKALDAMVAEMEGDGWEAGDGRDAGDAPHADGAHRADENGKVAHPGKAGDHSPKDSPESAGNVSAETSGDGSGASVPAETSAAAPEPSVSAETPVADSGGNVPAETSTATSEPSDSAKTPPLKPVRVRRATALVRIAEHYLATGGSGATPLRSSEAYQVFVHVNANDAHPDNRVNGGHTTYADDRRRVAPHVARQLACDASRRTVLENERGEVLNIGRRSRTVPWRIAHALRIRDGGCRFPGCGQRRWTDAHHIRHWADGGGTSLENLVTLCRYHHRSLHREEYRIERGAGGDLIFIDTQHQPIPPAIHPQFGYRPGSGGAAGTEVAPTAADRLERLQAENRGQGVEINESTAVTRWAGESMDYSTAIEWLLYKDGVAI